MDKVKEYLENWLNNLNNFSFQSYEKLPEFELYMDQAISFLDRQLAIFQTSSLDKQITSSMINNYVKGDVIPAPVSKRYNKKHLAMVQEICTLKQVLTIAEVKQIMDKTYDDPSIAKTYNSFNTLNVSKLDDAVEEAFKQLNKIDEGDTKALTNLALEFATTASAYNNIAKRILFLCRLYDETSTDEAEAKEE